MAFTRYLPTSMRFGDSRENIAQLPGAVARRIVSRGWNIKFAGTHLYPAWETASKHNENGSKSVNSRPLLDFHRPATVQLSSFRSAGTEHSFGRFQGLCDWQGHGSLRGRRHQHSSRGHREVVEPVLGPRASIDIDRCGRPLRIQSFGGWKVHAGSKR